VNPTNRTPAWFLLSRHWLSLLGVALVTTAAISWLFVLPQQIRGRVDNPYAGIVFFLILPILFVSGLALIPIGTYLSRRQIRSGLSAGKAERAAALRRLAWFFGITTLLNILIGTQITYRATKYMETPQFCGTSCHTMRPEFASYQNSPHSRVECVECHVASGAGGWISSKANGIRQVVETMFGTAPKPIPSALQSNRLVPARETCENCHWPQNFAGVRLRVFSKFAEDEGNTRTETVLLMLIGSNRIAGIHGAHLGPGVHIRYTASDPARQTIPLVEYRNDVTGESRSFAAPDPPGPSGHVPSQFDMQCVDCHNRPTHTFDLPERAVDNAMALGEIPTALPFVKKKGVELLKSGYASSHEADTRIPVALAAFYRQTYPEVYSRRTKDIQQTGETLRGIYNRNVFPDLNVTWGTYPNNLGHTDFPGCFRCHDGLHGAKDGKVIGQDCNTCHEPLATEEASPQILRTLAIDERLSAIQRK